MRTAGILYELCGAISLQQPSEVGHIITPTSQMKEMRQSNVKLLTRDHKAKEGAQPELKGHLINTEYTL